MRTSENGQRGQEFTSTANDVLRSPWLPEAKPVSGDNHIPGTLPYPLQPAVHCLLTIICAGLATGASDNGWFRGTTRHRRCPSRREPTREGSIRKRDGLAFIHRHRNRTASARCGKIIQNVRKPPTCFPSRLGEHDSRFAEGDHKLSFHELLVKCDQFTGGFFVQVLGLTPQPPEHLLNALRLVEIKVLVNGTPCAFQSTDNPAVNKVRVRSTLKESKVNRNTHERYWSPRRRRRACLLRRVGAFGCRRHRLRTNLDQRTRIHLKQPFRRVKIATGKKGKPIVRRSRDQSQAKYSPV